MDAGRIFCLHQADPYALPIKLNRRASIFWALFSDGMSVQNALNEYCCRLSVSKSDAEADFKAFTKIIFEHNLARETKRAPNNRFGEISLPGEVY